MIGHFDVSLRFMFFRIIRSIVIPLVFFCSWLPAQNNACNAFPVPSFTLNSGSKSKVIYGNEELSIYSYKKGRNGDSLYRRYSGWFVKLGHDTMCILTSGFSENRLYNLPRDSSRYNIVEFGKDSLIGLPLSEIPHLYYNRSFLRNTAFIAGALSVVSILAIGPAVSFEKDGFNNQRYETIAAVSFGVLTTSIVAGCGWGQKKYHLAATKKRKRVWLIQQPGN
jgi:hypothetical protein